MTDLGRPDVRSPKRAEAWARKAFRKADPLGVITGQNTLTVDPINGNDAAGYFNGKAIKTIARLNQLVNSVSIQKGSLVVTVLSQPPSTDAELDLTINYQNAAVPTGGVFAMAFLMKGVASAAHSGTLTVVSQVDGATNTREVVSDPAVTDWTVFQQPSVLSSKPIQVTSGPRSGNAAWLAFVDPAAKSSNPASQPVTAGSEIAPAGLQTGDAYSVLNLIGLKMRQVTLIGDGTGGAEIMGFQFTEWQSASQLNAVNMTNLDGPSNLNFTLCDFVPVVNAQGNAVLFVNCHMVQGWISSAEVIVSGGLVSPIANVAPTMDLLGVYLQGFTLGVNQSNDLLLTAGNTVDQGIQFWDVFFGPAIQAIGSNVLVSTFSGAVGPYLFGKSTNASFSANTIGVEVTGGGSLQFLNLFGVVPPTPPSVVGTGHYLPGSDGTDTDFTIDDVLATGAPPQPPVSRAWDEATSAYTAQIDDKWANLNAALPGGFGTVAQSPRTAAFIGTVLAGA